MGDSNNIKLIPMTRKLVHDMYKNFTSDPDIFAENFRNYTYNKEKVNGYFDRDMKFKNRKVFAICLEGNEIPVGELKLKNIDLNKKECTLSIYLNK